MCVSLVKTCFLNVLRELCFRPEIDSRCSFPSHIEGLEFPQSLPIWARWISVFGKRAFARLLRLRALLMSVPTSRHGSHTQSFQKKNPTLENSPPPKPQIFSPFDVEGMGRGECRLVVEDERDRGRRFVDGFQREHRVS